MKRHSHILIYIGLAVTLIISVTALCRSFYSDKALQVDYMGILVGILALLCTVLIGWQIISTINVRNIIEKFEEIERNRSFENVKIQRQIYENVATLTLQLASNAPKELLFAQIIMFELLSIAACSKLGEFDVCKERIDDLINNTPRGMTVTSDEKEFYEFAMSEVQDVRKIDNWTQLFSFISNLPIRREN